MGGITHILAATDLSSNASPAIDRGFLIAGASDARLTVLHAVGMDGLAPLREFLGTRLGAVSQSIIDDAGERLAQFVADSQAKGAVAADLRIEQGMASTVIPAFVRSEGVDLVLLGAHGAGFLQRMLLGSTTSRLLRTSGCPVLVVKRNARKAYERVLVTVDLSPVSEAIIRMAREVAPGAGLVLLHVLDMPFEGKMQLAGVDDSVIHHYRVEARTRAVSQLRELARNAGVSPEDFTGLVIHGDATRTIIEHEASCGCDLIAIGKHGTSVTEELLLGSVTKRVLAESRSDVLVLVDPRPADVARISP